MKKTKIAITICLLLIFSMTMPTFADIESVNRVDFVKALLDLNNIEVKEATISSFNDVTNPEDIPYVEAATKQGIISGYNGSFYPMSTITKEQAVTMVIKSFGELDIVNIVTPEMMEKYITFKDKETIPSWAKPYVTYGIMKGIIDTENEIFAPQNPITIEDLEEMIIKARPVFTREDLTASEMLAKVSDKLLEYKTMKYNLEMDMTSQVLETSEEDKPIETEIAMNMLMEAAMDQENDKIYIISTVKAEAEGEKIETATEIIMDNNVMYTKFPGVDKWMKQDINPLMQELEALLGTNMQNGTGVSQQQMELFGMKAAYLDDETINGEDYYVIFITVDKESFKAVMDEILDKALILATEMVGIDEVSQSEEGEMKQEIEAMISEMIKNMDMEVQYKYYVNEETKVLEKIAFEQVIHMTMGTMENLTSSTGSFRYYDFDEAIEIPVIQAKDIAPLEAIMEELPQ